MSRQVHRSSYQNNELNLSLTGSQISTPSMQRPLSAKLKRPSSMTDIRQRVKQDDKTSTRKARGPNHTPRSGVSSVASRQRELHSLSADAKTYRVPQTPDSCKGMRDGSKTTAQPNGNDDFLALFESSTKPVIRRGGSNEKKNAASSKKPHWSQSSNMPLSNKATIARIVQHDMTETGDNEHVPNVFRPNIAAADDSSSGVSDVDDNDNNDSMSLAQISRVLHEATELLTNEEPSAVNATAYKEITNNLSVLGKSPRPRASVSSIENIKHKTPVNVVKQGQLGHPDINEHENKADGSTMAVETKHMANSSVKSNYVKPIELERSLDRSRQSPRVDQRSGGILTERSGRSHGGVSDRSNEMKIDLMTDYKDDVRTLNINQDQNLSSYHKPTRQGWIANTRALNGTPVFSPATKLTTKPTPPAANREADGTDQCYDKAEVYIALVNRAATTIQRWYRRHVTRKRAAGAALKRILEQKRRDYEDDSFRQSVQVDVPIVDRKKVREEKAQAARKQAIEELHRKRFEHREDVRRKAEEQLNQLEKKGKVGRKKTTHRNGTTPCDLNPQTTNEVNVSNPDSATTKSPPPDVNIFFEDKNAEQRGDEARPSEAHTKTTLNDLLDTLRLLEQEERIAPTPRLLTSDTRDGGAGGESGGNLSKREYLSMEKLEKLNEKRSSGDRPGCLTDDKLKSIHSFLDEVDTADRVSHIDAEFTKMQEEMQYPPLLVPSVDDLLAMEHAAATANEVTSTVLSQKMELDEKKRTVKLLQKALNQQRELTVRHARESDKEMKKRLETQKNEYEEAVTRHLSFIDQLIDDKKALGEKCEHMVKELKTVDAKYQDKIKAMSESHAVEMKKLDEMHKAAEKLRREKWADDMTKKIKERTVKGLEPEIQRLIAKNKTELKKVKQIHEAELLEADERAAQRYVKMTEELRDQLALEKESACTRERELAKQRYEKQMQQEEESYQQQRRRLHSEVHDEKERLAQLAARQRLELDKLQRQLEDSHVSALDAMKAEFEKARVEQEKRHATELKEMKERLSIEREAWEANYKKKQDAVLAEKERELKESLRNERDQEIELVISRLEKDSTVSRQDCERTTENKIRRIREKYESEIRDLEISEKQAMDKYNKIKAHVTEVEGENERLKVIVRQKDDEISEVNKMSEKLHNERDRVSDVVRQEYADRIVATEEENKRVKGEMSELKSRQKIELEKMKTEMEVIQKHKDDEMEDVHKRVKQAIAKKDDVVAQLKQQYQAAVKRADHLEGLLDQQRKLISK